MKKKSLFEIRTAIPRHIYLLSGISFIAFILLAWQIVSQLKLVNPLFLPSPIDVINEGLRQLREGILLTDSKASIYRILVGWLFATLLAVPIGILMGNFKFIEGLLEPFIDLVRYMPVVALIPLTILWAGIGDFQKFLILFIGTFFQEVLMIMDNVKNVPLDLIKLGRTLGLSRYAILKDIILPASLPAIWDSFRITIGWTWTYLVVAELVAANNGLGRRIMDAQRYLATDTIFFGILFIGFLGLVTDLLFKFAGNKFFHWNKS